MGRARTGEAAAGELVAQRSATPDRGTPCMTIPGSNPTTYQLPSTTGVTYIYPPL